MTTVARTGVLFAAVAAPVNMSLRTLALHSKRAISGLTLLAVP